MGVTHLLGGTPPDTEVASLHEFLNSKAIQFPSLVFRSYVALAPFRFKALPTTLLVDPAGNVVAEAAGSRDLPMLLARAARLAREVPSNLTVVTLDDRARLCPKPDCEEGQELARLPTGLVLNVQAEKSIHLPRWEVIWFQVSYEGRRGWVSEFETDLAPQTPR